MSQTIKGWLVASASALACASVTACALAPERIPQASVAELCGYYSAHMNPSYLDPEIKAELIRRGAADCTDPALIQARIYASTAMFQQGMSMMAAAQAGESFATYAPPTTNSYVAPTTAYNGPSIQPSRSYFSAAKTGEARVGVSRECWYMSGNVLHTRTIGLAEICPISIMVPQ